MITRSKSKKARPFSRSLAGTLVAERAFWISERTFVRAERAELRAQHKAALEKSKALEVELARCHAAILRLVLGAAS